MDGTCQLCRVYRPDSNPREPYRPNVCDADRQLLDRHLTDIANLIAELANPEPLIVDQRRYERTGIRYLKHGQREVVSLGEVWADPLADLNGVAPINSRSNQPAVSGSRERPIPIAVTTLDLKATARVPHQTRAVADWPDDQVGHLSAATILDQWTRNIRAALFPDHHLPAATVDQLISWLRNRVDDVCDHYPLAAEFAEKIRDLRSVLRSVAGETEPQPEHCDGVPCKRCNLLTLYRQLDGDVNCINPDCQTILRDDEYYDWVKTLVAEQTILQRADANA